jgi:exosome complex RNA-binding protein Rrp42 (RNase PH superfamily)
MTTTSGEAASDSERVCANSARMASAMALPSMTLPRETEEEEEDVVSEEEDDIIIMVNSVVVVMHVVGGSSVVDGVDAGLDGRMLWRR